MTMRPPRRLLATAKIAAVVLTSAALTVTLAGPVAAHPHRDSDRGSRPERIALPDGFQPEGIAIDKGPRAYLGSRTDGDIISVNLQTGKRKLVSEGEGPGNPSVGLKVDNGLIYVARGGTGTGQVISARTGDVLNTFQFFDNPSVANPTFVNDVVLTRDRAWFTDSRNAQLYSVTRTKNPARAQQDTLPLTGDWVQTPGVNNANGIVQSPDRRSLLVVNSSNGTLYRVNPDTGVARVVDLGGFVLTNGDGLLLRGRTLYVVQNRLNQVAVLRLNYSGSQGRLVETLTSADLRRPATFDVPTTAAFYRGSLYLPNARFGNATPLTAEYWISRLRV